MPRVLHRSGPLSHCHERVEGWLVEMPLIAIITIYHNIVFGRGKEDEMIKI